MQDHPAISIFNTTGSSKPKQNPYAKTRKVEVFDLRAYARLRRDSISY